MTKQELMDEIYRLDPSYVDLKIDLSQYTEEELQICYDRKKNAPMQSKRRGGWYSNYTPKQSSRPRVRISEDEDYYTVPVTKEKEKVVSLTGFDALDKERMK
jgi:hypothetical protein